ncbi:MAG TPA: glycoside hydrolase domain-containing protein, partial [Niabella sp.]|nr:glycoside hydrolase domain-containing protein [Niabella sp.]
MLEIAMLKTKMFLFFGLLFLKGLSQDVSLELQKAPKLSEAQRIQMWKNVPKDVNVQFASSGARYARELPPAEAKKNTWEVSGWKNEKVHTQILAYSKKDLKAINVVAGNLTNSRGDVLNKEHISAGFVQYVMTDEFRDGCGHRKPVDFDSSMVADIINTDLKLVDIQKNTTQPVWLTIHIPETLPAGKYYGTVTVNAGIAYPLQVVLTVVDRMLPAPKDWKFQLDYWQHPAAIARVHN